MAQASAVTVFRIYKKTLSQKQRSNLKAFNLSKFPQVIIVFIAL
jgi:hypothetical protein